MLYKHDTNYLVILCSFTFFVNSAQMTKLLENDHRRLMKIRLA